MKAMETARVSVKGLAKALAEAVSVWALEVVLVWGMEWALVMAMQRYNLPPLALDST
jgi:hypothetical protein